MKNKYIFGGIIIVVFFGVMAYLFTKTNISYENDFTEIMKTNRTVKATGAWVKEKSYKIDREKNIFVFYLRDAEGKEMKVVYKGAMPNNFESSSTVVVTGKYKDGYFHATNILTKCPSKYQEEYKEETTSKT